jgi:hypothetical protein
MEQLKIGKLLSGRDFCVPVDYQVHTTALIGIRGSGKTVAATVLAEEMLEHGLPFVAIDPVGVWWGLRSAYQLVIVGGEHGDLPLEKDSGSRMAEAILEHNVPCVIDMSGESKTTVRKFVTDFCDRLMELNPSGTRHIFLEEAPELVPQRPMGEQKRSLAAVDRLVRLGRNKGYGCTIISQRFATINKDVLTQCENLIALRCIGKHDRDAAAAWIAEVVHDTESEKQADKFVKSLTRLENGDAWFWSPQWLKEFVQVHFRMRKSHHPGETRSVGQSAQQVQMVAVQDFVESFKRTLKRPQQESPAKTRRREELPIPQAIQDSSELDRLRQENRDLLSKLSRTMAVIDALRKRFEPEYRDYQALFADLNSADPSNGHHANREVWEPWKQKLGKRPGMMIEALLQRGELTRTQLATLTEQSANSGGYANNLSILNRNGLLERNGDKLKLRSI